MTNKKKNTSNKCKTYKNTINTGYHNPNIRYIAMPGKTDSIIAFIQECGRVLSR